MVCLNMFENHAPSAPSTKVHDLTYLSQHKPFLNNKPSPPLAPALQQIPSVRDFSIPWANISLSVHKLPPFLILSCSFCL